MSPAIHAPPADGPVRTASPAPPSTGPGRKLRAILCLNDFEAAARAHLPRPLFGYIAGAAEDNLSLRGNREAFDEWRFVPRVMVDISRRSMARELFGTPYAAPFGIAPVGLAALWAYRGDLALAKAAAQAGIPMIMSGSSLIRLEDVAAASHAENAPGSLMPSSRIWPRMSSL